MDCFYRKSDDNLYEFFILNDYIFTSWKHSIEKKNKYSEPSNGLLVNPDIETKRASWNLSDCFDENCVYKTRDTFCFQKMNKEQIC